jgi:hypothetical protein
MLPIRPLLLLVSLAVAGPVARAETFNLREAGRLSIFAAGDWHITGEDVGNFRIQLAPARPGINAVGQIDIASGVPDEYPTKRKLSWHVYQRAKEILQNGQFVEREPDVKEFYSRQGFGYYFTMTDPKLVGKPPKKGDYKIATSGLIRLAPGVMATVQIMADGVTKDEYQQLLGAVEGMELRAR